MEDLDLLEDKTFRYPVLYRAIALFSVLLFGFIVLGSVIAEVEAIQNSRIDAVLHVVVARRSVRQATQRGAVGSQVLR